MATARPGHSTIVLLLPGPVGPRTVPQPTWANSDERPLLLHRARRRARRGLRPAAVPARAARRRPRLGERPRRRLPDRQLPLPRVGVVAARGGRRVLPRVAAAT